MNSYSSREIINILTDIPIFNGLSHDDLNIIIPLLKPESYKPKTRIINEGSHGTSMYVICSGRVKVTRTEATGEEISLGFLYAGSYFGELSLIDNLPARQT